MRGTLVFIVTVTTFVLVTFLLWRNRTRNIAEVPAYLDSYWDIFKERRQFIRFKEQLPVSCTISEKSNDVHHVFSKDIAGDGVCLQATEILPEKSLLELKIHLQNTHKPILLKGEVVWVKESEDKSGAGGRLFDTGIRFVAISTEDKKRLDDFLVASYNKAA